jgi:putative ABC transport system permease protein
VATAGLSDEAAHAQARCEFGDVEAARAALRTEDERQGRRARIGELLAEARQDARFGMRTLRRAPGFTVVAAATLAIGIGASTAIFGAVDGVLLKPLPYPDADRVVVLWQQQRRDAAEQEELAPGTFVDVREQATSFGALAAAEPFSLDLQTPDGPETIPTWLVTEGYFDVLAVRPLMGRALRPDDHLPGGARVVVLAHRVWRERFGADSGIVGRALTLDGAPHTVVGVMPPTFQLPMGAELWAPKVISADERARRGGGYWLALGRLKPGVTPVSAAEELGRIARRLGREHPRTNADVDLLLVPLPEQLLGRARPALLLLLGASGVLLLITCANVANLTLARAMHRGRELAVRSALGAGRGRVVRLLAAEGAVLAALGGTCGVGLAWAGVRAIRAMAPADLPRAEDIGLDARVLAFAVGVTVATACLFTVVPALRGTGGARGGGLAEAIKAGGRSTPTRARHRTRRSLVVVEVALSLVLLVGAGLLVRSFVSLLRVDRGFRTDHVLAVTVQAWQWYPTPPQRAAFARAAVARLGALPGVRAAGVTSSLPLAEGIGQDETGFTVEGRPQPTGAEIPRTHVTVASPGYFDALGITLRRGRGFTDADDGRAAPVVLVTEALARRHFPGEDAVGRRIVVGIGRVAPAVAREIVGVVADVRQTGLAADPGPGVFLPHGQAPTGALTFTLRTVGDPALLTAAAKRELWALNGAMPIAGATTLDQLLSSAVRERRFHLALLGGFAAVALLLAAVGLYGVLSHGIRERRHEFGVRVALGARRADLTALVLREGALLVGVGAAIGCGLALAGTGLLRAMLFRVSPFDPLTFGAVTALVVLVAAGASLVPARRAAGADALPALRDS